MVQQNVNLQTKYELNWIIYINKNMNKFKINNMSGVLTINNNRYIPHQLHQLPKKFHEIPCSDIIKMKGYIYICESNFKNIRTTIDCLTHNRDLNYKEKR